MGEWILFIVISLIGMFLLYMAYRTIRYRETTRWALTRTLSRIEIISKGKSLLAGVICILFGLLFLAFGIRGVGNLLQ